MNGAIPPVRLMHSRRRQAGLPLHHAVTISVDPNTDLRCAASFVHTYL